MKLSLLIGMAFSLSLHAEVLEGKIHSIVKGTGKDPDIIRLESGRVVFAEAKDANLLEQSGSSERFQIITDDQNLMVAVRSVGKSFEVKETVESPLLESFEPTILGSTDEVNKIFNRLRNNYKRDSQCFNRAHVWANDELKNSGLKSMKVFVFFTASYITRNRFNWWFHIAPLVKVQDQGEVSSRVLDYRYADRPVTVKQWTDIFVFSSRPCLVTTKFSDYDVNPQTEDCYLITTNMYYWMPQDIAQRDTTGVEKDKFATGSIESATWAAF